VREGCERLQGEQLGQTSVLADVRSTLANVQTLLRRGVQHAGSSGTRWGAGMTQDSHPSPPTSKERRERRLLCGARQPRCAGTWVLRGGKTRGRWHSGGS